jgi:hypothetical protein
MLCDVKVKSHTFDVIAKGSHLILKGRVWFVPNLRPGEEEGLGVEPEIGSPPIDLCQVVKVCIICPDTPLCPYGTHTAGPATGCPANYTGRSIKNILR